MSRTPLWLGLTLLLTVGCSSIPLFSRHKFIEADARHPVAEILCVWEAAEGRGLDNMPSRGFGGQILLFANGIKEPVKAAGDVRIYVFDEEGGSGDPSKPLHQFDFPAAVWNAFLTPSNLGATYQIFVPYTRKGLHPASCSLRVRFTPEGGLPVYSKMAIVDLAGHASEYLNKPKDKPIETVGGEESEDQGIVTSDWSELIRDPQAVADSVQHPTPGISLGSVQTQARDKQTLTSLQQAVVDATQAEEAPQDPPPAAESAGLRLHPLRPASRVVDHGAVSTNSREILAPEFRDSSEPVVLKPRHPLEDIETD